MRQKYYTTLSRHTVALSASFTRNSLHKFKFA